MRPTPPNEITCIAIIGTGTVGAGWAAYFLARGLDVRAWDPSPDGEAVARRLIDECWPALDSIGLAAGADRTRLTFHESLSETLPGAHFVIENAPENESLKADLFAEIEGYVEPDTVIASSTSSLLISRIAARCVHPERCIAAHPFNPPHLVPLVELAGTGPDAEPALDWAEAFFQHVGKMPVRMRREMQGHIANRLTAALWREAVNLVAEGVADVADIDAAVSYGPGMRWATMGPHMTYHLGGGDGGIAHYLAHLGPSQEKRWKDLGAPSLDETVCQQLIDGVADEANGRSVSELRSMRDDALIALMQAVHPIGGPSTD